MVDVIVPFPPGDTQIVLPVKISATGLAIVDTFTGLLFAEAQKVVAFVPIT